jgi:hypothetical protein
MVDGEDFKVFKKAKGAKIFPNVTDEVVSRILANGLKTKPHAISRVIQLLRDILKEEN